MTLVAALDVLTALSVTGVTTNYDYDVMPGLIPSEALPALLVDPVGQFGEGFKAFDVGLTAGEAVVHFSHVLLMQGVGEGRPQDRLGKWATFVDNYYAALKTDLKLTDTLIQPLVVLGTAPQVVEYAGLAYVGLIFRHRWVLKI